MPSDPHIRIVLADDHALYRLSLVRAVAAHPRLLMLGEYADGDAALAGIVDTEPDVAVLDLDMPGRCGVEVVEALRARGLATQVLVLTGSAQAKDLYRALAAGARGFVSKASRPSELYAAISAVACGQVRFPVGLQAELAAEIRTRTADLARPR